MNIHFSLKAYINRYCFIHQLIDVLELHRQIIVRHTKFQTREYINILTRPTFRPKKFVISCSVSEFNPICLEGNLSVCGKSCSIFDMPVEQHRLEIARTDLAVVVPSIMLETRSVVIAVQGLYIVYAFARWNEHWKLFANPRLPLNISTKWRTFRGYHAIRFLTNKKSTGSQSPK